jgi:glutamate synthase domain-containing protein 3
MIGRVDMLEVDTEIKHWKARSLNLLPILTPAMKRHEGVDLYCTRKQDHGLERSIDNKLIELARPALERGEKVSAKMDIRNIHRAVGTTLSHEISKRFGEHGLPDDTIHFEMTGSAGQSFGAWLQRGVTLELAGDGNDYVGKGLSGGRLIIYPPPNSGFVAEENIIIGNVALYGATSGRAFFRGTSAERFCVRNSGAWVVVEGVGDHGCEYMTGGRVVILGETGRNFAAGMSGGVAFVWDPEGKVLSRANTEMVELETLRDPDYVREVRELIEEHLAYTGSTVAASILADWEASVSQFIMVIPTIYRQILTREKTEALVTQKGA